MAGIRGKNTRPEIAIRRALHRKGFRYRLHATHIPGKPDLYFKKYRAALFVHGCFWHGHDCPLFKVPATRTSFWKSKIASNRNRDAVVEKAIKDARLRHATVWECAFRGRGQLGLEETVRRLSLWLKSPRKSVEIRGRSKHITLKSEPPRRKS